ARFAPFCPGAIRFTVSPHTHALERMKRMKRMKRVEPCPSATGFDRPVADDTMERRRITRAAWHSPGHVGTLEISPDVRLADRLCGRGDHSVHAAPLAA